MAEPMIRVRDIVKTYKVAQRVPGRWSAVRSFFAREVKLVKALDGISFDIPKGQLCGYIGPNGAGKSTTIKVMTGILTPDSGQCEVGGFVPWRDRPRYVGGIGVVFGQRTQLWWDLPVLDSFELLRDIYRIPVGSYKNMLDELVERLSLAEILRTPVRQLSLGQRMRCELCASLLHSPGVLFLDEPTIGLDAISKLAVREFLLETCRAHGTTLILTTHDMDDIEALCQRVLLIGRGRILLDGGVQDLRRSAAATRRLSAEFSQDVAVPQLPQGARLIEAEARRLKIAFDPSAVSPAELMALLDGLGGLRDVEMTAPPIDEAVAALYGELNLTAEGLQ